LIALLIPIYLFTFAKTLDWLFPAFLILAGLAISSTLLKETVGRVIPQSGKSFLGSIFKQNPAGKSERKNQFSNIIYYTLLAIGLLTVLAEVEPAIFHSQIIGLELTGIDAILFGVMMAVGEEDLFRNGVTNWLLQHVKAPFIAFILSASIFMMYHFAIYGDNTVALVYVFSAGLILAYVDEMSGSDTPSKIAHITNNILAYSSTTVFGLFGSIMQSSQYLLIFACFTLLAFILYNRRKGKEQK